VLTSWQSISRAFIDLKPHTIAFQPGFFFELRTNRSNNYLRPMRIYPIILILFFFIPAGHSQQPAHFFLGRTEFEGVQIYDVIQDTELNYWFATDQGFYTYDGYDFTRVENRELKGQAAFGFVSNKNGVIFCYNLNHQVLKIENGECSVFYELRETERSSDLFLEITDGNALLVLCGTILLFDESGKQHEIENLPAAYYGFPFRTDHGTVVSHILGKDSVVVINGTAASVHPLKNQGEPVAGLLKFFRTGTKTYAVDISNRKFYGFDDHNLSLHVLPHQPVQDDKEYLRYYVERDILWVAGTVAGVRMITDPAKPEQPEQMFGQYLVSDVYADTEGNLLLSTFNHGVIVVPNLSIPDVLPVPGGHSIVSLAHDGEPGLLMGTPEGSLMSYANGVFKTLHAEGSRPLQAIYSWPEFPYILFDDGSIKAYHKETGAVTDVLSASLKGATMAGENTLYLALNLGVHELRLSGNTISTQAFSPLQIRSYAIAFEPGRQMIYVATSDGLKMIDTAGNVLPVMQGSDVVFANYITVANNRVFVSTTSHGILVLENGVLVNQLWPTIRGQSAEVFKLRVVDDRLYMNTSRGFAIMNTDGKVLAWLNREHGFSTNRIFDFDVVDHELWITHSGGLQKIDPAQLTAAVSTPLMRIARIEVNDSALADIPTAGKFDSQQRKFLFTLSSPTLRNKENTRYFYRLGGYDAGWQQAPYDENKIIYNALAPGNYTFFAKAENRGVFSETVSWSFSIASPFYLRWWFITTIILAFVFLTLFIYRRQLRRQRKKAMIANEINLSKLAAIQSQMNPHFIFNCLNSIQDLVLKEDIDNAYIFIAKFSDLIRRTLNYSDKEFIDFEYEIELLELYLSLEKLRFKAGLEYTIDTGTVEDIAIPPMLVQPFIENALVHGLLHKQGQKNIHITFRLNDTLVCTIEDNGIGRKKAAEIKSRQGNGHASFSGEAIKKRFAILNEQFKDGLGFSFEDLYLEDQPAGLRVTLRIPVKHKF
jgi:hypothetical protein